MNYDFSFFSTQKRWNVRVTYLGKRYGPQSATYSRAVLVRETELEKSIKSMHLKFDLDASFVDILDISCNGITVIPEVFSQFVRLRTFLAPHNSLVSLPRDFEKLAALKEIDLRSNRFAAFPRELLALTQLESLDLSENYLTALPRELITFEKMTDLFVRSNMLQWLPIELRDWNAQLYMHDNCFGPRPFHEFDAISYEGLLDIFSVTKHIGMIQHAAGTVCIAMQNWNLPALLMLMIIDELFENDIRMWAKWELITAVKHFHARNDIKHD